MRSQLTLLPQSLATSHGWRRQLPLILLVLFGIALSVFFAMGKPMFVPVAIGGILVAIPVLMQPRIGLYLTVAAVPLDQVGKLGQILPYVDITIAKLFAILTLLAWLVHLGTRRLRFIWCRELGIFLVYFLIGALTLLDALELKRGLQELVILGTTILFFVMVYNLLHTKRQIAIALGLLAAVSAVTFAYAGVQRFLPGTLIKERVGWLAEGEATSGVEVSNIEEASIGTVYRSTGTTAHSNVLATSTALLIPVLFAFLRFARRRRVRLLIWCAVLACLVGAVDSLSRTGILTYALVIPPLLALRFIRVTPLRVVVLAVLLAASIPFLPEGVSRIFNPANYFSTKSVSVSERYKLWDAASRAFIDNPLTGFGIGNNRGIFAYYKNPWNPGLLTVHNSYLQIAIETGIFGLLALLYFFSRIIRLLLHAINRFRQQGDDWGEIFAIALLISIGAFLLMGGVAFDFMRIGFKNVWLFIGCAVALYRIAVLQAEAATPDKAG